MWTNLYYSVVLKWITNSQLWGYDDWYPPFNCCNYLLPKMDSIWTSLCPSNLSVCDKQDTHQFFHQSQLKTQVLGFYLLLPILPHLIFSLYQLFSTYGLQTLGIPGILLRTSWVKNFFIIILRLPAYFTDGAKASFIAGKTVIAVARMSVCWNHTGWHCTYTCSK